MEEWNAQFHYSVLEFTMWTSFGANMATLKHFDNTARSEILVHCAGVAE